MKIQTFVPLLVFAADLIGGTHAKMRTRRLQVTISELQSHNTDSDCWVQVNDNAYDVTAYAPLHPGGAASIYATCGEDITEAYFAPTLVAFHTDAALSVPTVSNMGIVVADSVTPEGPITMGMFLSHNSQESCWIMVGDLAYDVTAYAPLHPGGAASIYAACGKDITEEYFAADLLAFHTSAALDAAEELGLVFPDGFSGECFPGDATVQVEDRGPVSMKDLQLGDKVLTSDNQFETVYSFGHKNTDAMGEFVKLSTKGAVSLELSTLHMVYLKGGAIVPAGIVKIGDELELVDGTFAPVRAIKIVEKQGKFAPFTASGSIMVNGIKASSFVAFQESGTVRIGGILDTGVSFQFLAHAFELPHRIWCLQLSSCETETYSKEGISTWVDVPHKMANFVFHSGGAAAAAAAVLAAFMVVAVSKTQVRLGNKKIV